MGGVKKKWAFRRSRDNMGLSDAIIINLSLCVQTLFRFVVTVQSCRSFLTLTSYTFISLLHDQHLLSSSRYISISANSARSRTL